MNDNRFCAYVHKDSNGVVKYVGSGTLKRAYENYANSNRGKRYAEFVKANGKLTAEIVVEGLSKNSAEDLERELYDEYYETILNVRRPVSLVIMTKEMFDEYLYYDETSPSCLKWKVDRVSPNGAFKIKADSEAGSLNKSDNYYVVKLQGKLYLAHRIICVLHGLELNGFLVDHIDRNRFNNNISNLRVVTYKENNHNLSQQKLSSRNTSGVQGVQYHKRGYWVANWCEDGKKRLKYFPIKSYNSSEQAFNAAVQFRQQMVDLYYK